MSKHVTHLTSNCLCLKATDDHTKPSETDVPGSVDLANHSFQTESLEFTYPADEVMQGAEEMHILEEQGGSAAPVTDLIMADLESTQCCESQPESQLSQPADFVPTEVHTESQSAELRVEESKESCETNEKVIPHMEEESIMKMLEGGSLTGKNKEEMNDATEGKSYTAGENESESDFVIKESVLPVVVVSEREYEMNDQNLLSPALSLSQEWDSVALVPESAMEIDSKPDEKSIPALNVSFIDNKEVAFDSATVIGFNTGETKDDKSIPSQGRIAEDKGKDSGEEKSTKKENVNAEKLKEDSSQAKKDDRRNNNLFPETEAPIVIPEMEIPKSPRRGETEVMETQQRPYKVDKSPKLLTKAQAEKRLTEKDQAAVQPIIILPDTRETVIKNVAKKRSTPVIPEIKVTLPERVKREEPVIVPRSEILKLEPERVMQPLTQEVAQIFREKERQTDDATRASGESTSNSALVIPDLLGVNRNTQSSPSVEEQGSVNTGRGREDDNNIPIINIACADDNTTTLEQEQSHGHPSLPGIVISQDIPQDVSPISDNKNDDSETLGTIMKSDNQHGPDATSEKPKEQLMAQLSPDMSTKTPPSIANQDPDKVPQPKDARVESESDRLQKDKPSIEKLSLTTPVGPTLPPLSPASLRRLMAKNNPNLESQGSISAASVDGSEKKGEESGGSTPTSTLSCESSPKMKRRDSLTLIPSATPEELASGARRKIYLAKTKSEDEGSDTQGKRDSPYMAAFLQLQSGQQTPPTERRSPLMARRKATLEVPKPKEEMAEVTDNTKTESKPAEKEKLDPFKDSR
ncbi:hypothetical protein M9458_036406 [Cirrhinus mrigala]|uniref:Uncharacterized protein n=1 Tax=Cirrhinus mrigala TaxID=683832 RepID=A0ABD0P240_CIRMR